MMRTIVVALLVLSLVGPAESDPSANAWVKIGSKEGKGGPVLEITRADGTVQTLDVVADTGLIAYIPNFGIGNRPYNAIDESGWNRVLVRFDLSAVKGPVKSAQLVLTWTQSQIPITKPLEAGVHRIDASWREQGTTWQGAPGFDAKALATFQLEPSKATVRIDVSDAVKAGATKPADFHGWLIKSTTWVPVPAHMMPGGQRTTGGKKRGTPRRGPSVPVRRGPVRKGSQLVKDILAQVPWQPDAKAAVSGAAKEGKLALALVRASFSPNVPNDNEEIFLATVLAHPAVAALVRDHFVSTRVSYHAASYTMKNGGRNDPLLAMGTSAATVKPLALVVSDGTGKLVGVRDGMGTFDGRALHTWLNGLLKGAGKQTDAAWPEASGEGWGRYLAVVKAVQAGNKSEAHKLATAAPSDDAYKHLMGCWVTWPERMAMYGQPGALRTSAAPIEGATPHPTSTEVSLPEARLGAFVGRPLLYLMKSQREDGSWPTAQTYAANTPGVTALAARALLAWRARVQGGTRKRLDACVEKALAWCQAWMEKTDPAQANSFGTTYVLDFLLDMASKDAQHKALAQQATTFHARGQAPNGGWGYSHQFAVRWRGGFGGWPVTTKGRVHSMNTAPALLALLRAKALGLRVDDAVLAKGKTALLAMKAGPASFTYTWPEPRNFEGLRTSIGRACACEQALLGLGAGKEADLELAVKTFLTHREDLHRMAKVSAGWTPPAAVSSYFKYFAYHHAMRSIQALPEGQRAARLATLRADLLGCIESDGTWVDYIGVGKPYGTAMALMVLATVP